MHYYVQIILNVCHVSQIREETKVHDARFAFWLPFTDVASKILDLKVEIARIALDLAQNTARPLADIGYFRCKHWPQWK